MSFDDLGLRTELIKAVKSRKYKTPTPIQAQAIPIILDGRDILARAQTGTGKTDAFALPMVDLLSRTKSRDRHPRALVLAPTRELALQVGEVIKAYARRISLRCTVVYGGVRITPQIDRLKRGIDVLVATPGRLLDLAGQRRLNLSRIEYLVFDEADRMLDLGFSEEISEILEIVPSERSTMLFSATYTQQIKDLAGRMLRDPEFIEVTPSISVAESVTHTVHRVDRHNKRDLLIHLITNGHWRRTLIFARTKHGANKLCDKLTERGISAAPLHGNMSQSVRTRTLKSFKSGQVHILVATDVAARGLDISGLPLVVNYDMPSIPENYVHRIGRTGRAGAAGKAISLVSPEETPFLLAIEKLLDQKIPAEPIVGFTEGTDVPDYVLYRPNSTTSKKKADKSIKALADGRTAKKQLAKKRRNAPAADRNQKPKSKPRSVRKKDTSGKPTSRNTSRPSPAPPKRRPRRKR